MIACPLTPAFDDCGSRSVLVVSGPGCLRLALENHDEVYVGRREAVEEFDVTEVLRDKPGLGKSVLEYSAGFVMREPYLPRASIFADQLVLLKLVGELLST